MTFKRSTRASSKREFWESHIENWARSGFSQAEYCRQNNLRIKSFGYWKRKLTKKNCSLELVQLTPEQILVSPSLRLHVGSRYQIEIPDGFSHAALKNVLQVLRAL